MPKGKQQFPNEKCSTFDHLLLFKGNFYSNHMQKSCWSRSAALLFLTVYLVPSGVTCNCCEFWKVAVLI